MNKKHLLVIAASVLVLLVGTFVVGRLSVDPKASEEYASLEKTLNKTADELDNAQSDYADAQSDLQDTESALDEAEAKVAALSTQPKNLGAGTAEPAFSGGAAVIARDFQFRIRTRSKECFGSAGCLLTVQIDPNYVGKQDVSTGSWEITYEVRGGEDGPVIETMTLEDGTFTFPSEQDLSTSSSTAVITAVATEVFPLD